MPSWPIPTVSAAERVAQAHRKAVGDPAAVADAPATYPVIGEHVDHYGGAVVMGLSSLRAAVAYSPRADGRVTVTTHYPGAQPVTDEISDEGIRQRAAQQQPGVDDHGHPTVAPVPVGGAAARVGGLVWTLIHRQLLSRDTGGLDVTVVNDIPRGVGLGADAAVDAALALALQAGDEDIDQAPARARLAETCSQSNEMFSAFPPLRARHTAALRGLGESVSVLDYADGSVTQAPHPVDSEHRAFLVGLPERRQPDHSPGVDTVRRHRRFVEDACKAFGAESLRLLPDAPGRVLDWLRAVHQVRGTDGTPTVAEAAGWLNFDETETRRVVLTARALRSRRGEDIGSLLAESQRQLHPLLGVDACDELAALCRSRGAVAARATAAGLASGVWALVPARAAANFAADLVDDGLLVVELHRGERAAVLTPASA